MHAKGIAGLMLKDCLSGLHEKRAEALCAGVSSAVSGGRRLACGAQSKRTAIRNASAYRALGGLVAALDRRRCPVTADDTSVPKYRSNCPTRNIGYDPRQPCRRVRPRLAHSNHLARLACAVATSSPRSLPCSMKMGETSGAESIVWCAAAFQCMPRHDTTAAPHRKPVPSRPAHRRGSGPRG